MTAKTKCGCNVNALIERGFEVARNPKNPDFWLVIGANNCPFCGTYQDNNE